MRLINLDDIISVSMYDEEHEEWSTEMMTVEEALCFYAEVPEIIEKKDGHWIPDRLVSTSGGTYGVWRCSICEDYYQGVGHGWNYCPNCGSRMVTE